MATIKLNKPGKPAARRPADDRMPVRGAGAGVKARPTLAQLFLVACFPFSASHLRLGERRARSGRATTHRGAVGIRRAGRRFLLELEGDHGSIGAWRAPDYAPMPNKSRNASRYWCWPTPFVL